MFGTSKPVRLIAVAYVAVVACSDGNEATATDTRASSETSESGTTSFGTGDTSGGETGASMIPPECLPVVEPPTQECMDALEATCAALDSERACMSTPILPPDRTGLSGEFACAWSSSKIVRVEDMECSIESMGFTCYGAAYAGTGGTGCYLLECPAGMVLDPSPAYRKLANGSVKLVDLFYCGWVPLAYPPCAVNPMAPEECMCSCSDGADPTDGTSGTEDTGTG